MYDEIRTEMGRHGTPFQVQLEEVLNSIPEKGSNPETEKLFSSIIDALLPEEFVAHLRSIGLDVEKVSGSMSKNKIELIMIIKYPDLERQAIVRYRKGEPVLFRFTEGMYDGEKTLYEEELTGTIEEVGTRVRSIIEGLVAPK